MDEVGSLNPFQNSDRFLRRVRFADHIKNGLLNWRTFKEKDDVLTLSFTHQVDELRTERGLDAYREYWSRAIGGDLPGILWLSYEGLAVRITPPLLPRYARDDSDPVYGHLHCSTEKPCDKAHMQMLAKLVNDGDFGGILCEVVKRFAA